MTKSILMSIRPEWVAKILNGEKTIEIRKKFPVDYIGWVYIYCTKGKPYLFRKWVRDLAFWQEKDINEEDTLNGKVVARFWCDKVEETFFQQEESFNNEIEKTLKSSCLTYDELWNYVENKTFYKIHISQLEIFDEPRELSEFNSWLVSEETHLLKKLTKAPQSWQYIEGEE